MADTPDPDNEEVPCNEHPDAPHGYDRNSSHNAGRYVCDCEGWSPDEVVQEETCPLPDVGGLTFEYIMSEQDLVVQEVVAAEIKRVEAFGNWQYSRILEKYERLLARYEAATAKERTPK